jgi:hypothetical protein
VIFLGLQFGVVFKDLQELDYIPSSCTFSDIKVSKKYSCDRHFNFYGCQNYNGPKCSDVLINNHKLNPDLCTTNNTENCAYTGECSNGYKCCKELCQTCQRCNTIIDSNGNTIKECTNYDCNCFCMISVQNNLGSITCDILYTLNMNINYDDFIVPYTKDYKTDLNSLNLDISKFSNNTLNCFHNKENTDVVFDQEINKVGFAFYGICCILLLFQLLCLCYSCFVDCKPSISSIPSNIPTSTNIPTPTNIPTNVPTNIPTSTNIPSNVPSAPVPEVPIAEAIIIEDDYKDPYNPQYV